MYSYKSSINLNYKLNLSNDTNNVNTNNDTNNIYKNILQLNEELNNVKNKINKYYENNCILWDKLKKFSNEYEFIYSSSCNSYKNISTIYPISRSYFKLWEIIHDFKYLINFNDNESFRSAHIAEGPGGFIECIYKYINSYFDKNIFPKVKIFGLTLLSDNTNIPNWKIKKNIINTFNIELNNKEQCDGDLYSLSNINIFLKNIGENSCNLITCDGGFDFSYNYNEQEENFIFFFISEIYMILKLLKNGGNTIIKIYDIYSKNSIKIMYIISLFFEKIYIIKPLTSRPANSEKYILCYRYKDFNESKIYFNIFETIIQDKDLNHLNNDKVAVEYNFIEKILEYNRWYTERQISYINKTIKYIDEYNNNTDKNYLIKLYNYNKKKCVNWCRKYNIY